jgi:hypothetical protein
MTQNDRRSFDASKLKGGVGSLSTDTEHYGEAFENVEIPSLILHLRLVHRFDICRQL